MVAVLSCRKHPQAMMAMDAVGDWLERQTLPWVAVDPMAFAEACTELEVWEEWGLEAREPLEDWFEELTASALHRFIDVSIALSDGSLAEFTWDTDDGQIAMPIEIFWAAALSPFDEAGEMIDRRVWRQTIAALMAQSEEAP